MIITAYRIESRWRNQSDTFSLVRPSEGVYGEYQYELPEGYELGLRQDGFPAIYSPEGGHCEICLASNGRSALLVTSKGMKGLKEVSESQPKPIKQLRIESGLTQQQLADIVGINISQIQKLESGERKIENVTAKNFMAIADALGVDPKELL